MPKLSLASIVKIITEVVVEATTARFFYKNLYKLWEKIVI